MRLLSFLAALACVASAWGQGYPSKPIRLVVGYPPGGSGDFTTRVIADELAKDLGATVIVENKAGAGGSIASEFVAKSAPDGYTLLNQGNHAIAKNLYKNLGYDQKDFVPVSRVAVGTTILVVNNDTPFKNLQDLVAYAKANPGKLFNAAAGFGSAPHLAAAAFEAAAGIRFTTVQFKGGGPASQSLLAGDTQVMFATSPTVTGFIKAGRMRPLAVSMRKGSSPPFRAFRGRKRRAYRSSRRFWFGLYALAGTPSTRRRRSASRSGARSCPRSRRPSRRSPRSGTSTPRMRPGS